MAEKEPDFDMLARGSVWSADVWRRAWEAADPRSWALVEALAVPGQPPAFFATALNSALREVSAPTTEAAPR